MVASDPFLHTAWSTCLPVWVVIEDQALPCELVVCAAELSNVESYMPALKKVLDSLHAHTGNGCTQ